MRTLPLLAVVPVFGVGVIVGTFLCVSLQSGDLLGDKSVRNEDNSTSRPPPVRFNKVLSDHTTAQEIPHSKTTSGQASNDDPLSSLADALAIPDGLARDRSLLAALDRWAVENNIEAFYWLNENFDTVSNFPALYAVVMKHHIDQNPESAAVLIEAMEVGSLKTSLAGQLAARFADDRPESALVWAKSLEDPDARRQALGISLQAIARVNPERALNEALAQADPQLQNELVDQVGLIMARQDPTGTLSRIADFPKSVHSEMIGHIASAWAAIAPNDAAAWIRTIPPGPSRDNAISRAVHRLSSLKPRDRFNLAASVNDSAKRYGLIRDVLLSWHDSAPDAFETALATTDQLTDIQKQNLLNDVHENAPLNDFVIPAR